MDHKKLLLQALADSQEEQTLLLQSFVRAASPNPPGDTRAAAAVITKYLDVKGIPYQCIDPQNNGQPNILSDFQGGRGPGPRVVLNGHVDVFPVGDSGGWIRDPWSGDIEDGRLHGRGVVDMKSGTISLVVAYACLYEKREYITGSVALCAVSDEETGGKWGTTYIIEQDRKRWGGDLMLSTEPGGCGTVRFAEKGTLRLTGTVNTLGTHGAYLNKSKGAIRTAAYFLRDVIESVESMPGDLPKEILDHLKKPEVRDAIDRTMGAGTAAIIARPTVNVGTIKGGLKVNMIPGTCVFELDIRLPIGLLAKQVLDTIDAIIPQYKEATITIDVQTAASNPSSYSSNNHPIVNLLAENAEQITPSIGRPIPIPSMGGTDCKHYRYAGVPAYVYGCSPTTMGEINESALVSEFLHVTKVMAATTLDFLCE